MVSVRAGSSGSAANYGLPSFYLYPGSIKVAATADVLAHSGAGESYLDGP